MNVEAFPNRSRRRNRLLLPLRFLLYWLVKSLVLLFLGARSVLRPRLVRYGLLALLVAGGVAWKSSGVPAFLPWSTPSAAPGFVSTAVADQPPRPAVVEHYLAAQAEYDAARMWDTMSDRFKQRMLATRNSPEQLQKELDTARNQGRRYSSATYVGGLELDGGRAAYFYVLLVDGPNGPARLPYTFLVDQDGKITNVQWSLER